MRKPTDRLRGRSAGGADRLPPIDDLLAVDEGPMRRELMRQISALEAAMSQLVIDNALHAKEHASPTRGPAILSTADLERVRDELLATIARLHGRILQRVEWEVDEPRVRRGMLRLRRRRSSPSG
jgi:hypothetical protein